MSKRTFVSFCSVALMSGCASNSANMRIGSDLSYVSLREQRDAATTVKEFASAPEGAIRVGRVDAARCHRNTLQAQPTEEDIKLDLKVAAYAKGADGITDIKISSASGLLQNCWYILNAEATAISLRR